MPFILEQNDLRRPASFFVFGFGAGGFRLPPVALLYEARPFALSPPFGFLPSLRVHAAVLAILFLFSRFLWFLKRLCCRGALGSRLSHPFTWPLCNPLAFGVNVTVQPLLHPCPLVDLTGFDLGPGRFEWQPHLRSPNLTLLFVVAFAIKPRAYGYCWIESTLKVYPSWLAMGPCLFCHASNWPY